jgi:hypothetical protein
LRKQPEIDATQPAAEFSFVFLPTIIVIISCTDSEEAIEIDV